MSPSLLDTNILSELKRPRPSHRVIGYLNACPLDELHISSVTIAEIRFGIHAAIDPVRREEIEVWLANTIRPMFSGRVLEVTENIMLRWRILVEEGRKSGRTFPQPDLILAATALEHNLTVVTRNTKDFAGLGLTLVNPWDI